MKAQEVKKQAMEMLGSMTLMDLIDEWELTTTVNDPSVYEVRGWLMDEISSRNPEGFDRWLNLDEPKDEELRDYIL